MVAASPRYPGRRPRGGEGGGSSGSAGAGESTETETGTGGERWSSGWDDVLARLAVEPVEEGWATLQDASAAAGVPVPTLRSWYRTGQLPSRMVMGPHGPQRVVPLDAVVGLAMSSARARRRLEHARSLEAEVEELRHRVEILERHIGLR